jgi:hypothetical protein
MSDSQATSDPTAGVTTPNPSGGAPDTPTDTPADPGGGAGRYVLGFLVLVAVVFIILVLVAGPVRHWFALHTGTLHGGPDIYYNFWSGFGSDLGEATLISAVGVGVYTGVRKVNCHTKGCWRIGHHALDGTPYILCRHHHPHVPSAGASHDQILEQHRRYKEQQGQGAR